MFYLGGISWHHRLHPKGASHHRVAVVADVDLVLALLRGDVLHTVSAFALVGLQLAGDGAAGGRGHLHTHVALPASPLGVDGELLILPNHHFCRTKKK